MDPPKKAWLLGCALVLAPFLEGCNRPIVQSSKQFNEAINDFSTLNYIVKIEFADLRSDTVKQECVFAGLLRLAVAKEAGLPREIISDQAFLRKIGQAPRHRFEFRNPAAIDTLHLKFGKSDMQEACAIIDTGRQAMIGDYAPNLYAGSDDGKSWTQVD